MVHRLIVDPIRLRLNPRPLHTEAVCLHAERGHQIQIAPDPFPVSGSPPAVRAVADAVRPAPFVPVRPDGAALDFRRRRGNAQKNAFRQPVALHHRSPLCIIPNLLTVPPVRQAASPPAFFRGRIPFTGKDRAIGSAGSGASSPPPRLLRFHRMIFPSVTL